MNSTIYGLLSQLEAEITRLETQVSELAAANLQKQQLINQLQSEKAALCAPPPPVQQFAPPPQPVLQQYVQPVQQYESPPFVQQYVEPPPVQQYAPPPPQSIINTPNLQYHQQAQAQYAQKAKEKSVGWERKIGLNLLNKIGILLVIFGVIATAAHPGINEGLRGALLFALGLTMVGAGELLSRKKANVFSLGMTAGGVAVTYASLAASYFVLRIFSAQSAALLCLVITVGAFYLSIRRGSQVIAVFSIIGGFLPLLTLSSSLDAMTFSAMAYFVVLGGFALSLSFKKKWIVSAFFGLSLNIIAMFDIISRFDRHDPAAHKAALLLYVFASFLTYTLIPVIGTYVEKLRFKKSDVVLIAINTFFSACLALGVFQKLGIGEHDWLIAVIFMGIYLALGYFLRQKMPEAGDMKMLFFISSTTAFALIVPLYSGVVWVTLGWLLQGVMLAGYGILKDKLRFTVSGFAIGGLCLLTFLSFDVTGYASEHFELKFFAITAGALLLTAAYAYKRRSDGRHKALKYCSVINLWFFLIYITERGFDRFLRDTGRFDLDYLFCSAIIVITFGLAFALPRIKPIAAGDGGIPILARIFFIIGKLVLLFQNGYLSPLKSQTGGSAGVVVTASLLLIGVNLISVLALADMLRHFTKRGRIRAEWLPFLTSGYFTIILTQNLTVYYGVPFAGMTISLIYGALAVAWCGFGFWKRFAFMRRFGLGTALVAVSKVFLIDLWSLTEGYRIITFFALGGALIAISFTYQYFTKRIER